MIDIAAAFASIRAARDKLNTLDNKLSDVIVQVETALNDLKPGIRVEVPYTLDEEEHWLIFGKMSNGWRILYARKEESKEQPLVSASRLARVNAFREVVDGQTPIELLILETTDALLEAAAERTSVVKRAEALSAAILALGTNPVE